MIKLGAAWEYLLEKQAKESYDPVPAVAGAAGAGLGGLYGHLATRGTRLGKLGKGLAIAGGAATMGGLGYKGWKQAGGKHFLRTFGINPKSSELNQVFAAHKKAGGDVKTMSQQDINRGVLKLRGGR